MHYQQFEIIADTLCNLFDWDSQDLKMDFMNSLKENDVQITDQVAEKIFDDFVRLDAKTRNSPRFDYQKFISDRYIS